MAKAQASPAIDARRIALDELEAGAFPAVQPDEPFRVLIDAAVHEAILLHAAETTRVEVGGVLAGRPRRDARGAFLEVKGAIRAEKARNEGAQITFTHESWAHIQDVMDRERPGERIVGWYHTHPSFGIFLSDMDKFIHESFFQAPWQVALVVDPVAKLEGLFAWREGKAMPLARYWVGAEERWSAGTAGAGMAATRGGPVNLDDARGGGGRGAAGAGGGAGVDDDRGSLIGVILRGLVFATALLVVVLLWLEIAWTRRVAEATLRELLDLKKQLAPAPPSLVPPAGGGGGFWDAVTTEPAEGARKPL